MRCERKTPDGFNREINAEIWPMQVVGCGLLNIHELPHGGVLK